MTEDADKEQGRTSSGLERPEVTIRMDTADVAKAETAEEAERRRETVADIQRQNRRGRAAHVTRTTRTFSTLVDFVKDRILSLPRDKGGDDEEIFKGPRPDGDAPQLVDLSQALVQALPHELGVRYMRIKEFAGGGQGTVATATDTILHRTVALKSLRKEHLENETIRKAFVNEALITAQLEHPAIISVYSLMSDDENGLHLAMQLVHGKTFHDVLNDDMERIEQHRPNRWHYLSQLHRRCNTLIHVSEAIAFAHSKGIIHCDLKPENIMFGEYGSVFVMDWGIARRIGTQQEQLDGTPRYMPPEVFETLKRETSGDIYALGMILYEIATFKAPFAGYSTREIIHKVRSGERCPIENSYGMPIPPALAAIIRKATAFKPSDRYATVTEMISDIRLMLEDEPITALKETIVTRLVRLLKHYSRTFLSLMLVSWLIILGVSFRSLKKNYFATRQSLTHAQTLNTTLRSDRLHLQLVQELANVDNRMQKQAFTLASGFLVATTHLRDLKDKVANLCRSAAAEGGDFMPAISQAEWNDPKSRAHDGPYSNVYKAVLNPHVCSYNVPADADPQRVTEELARLRPATDALAQLLFSSSGIILPEKSEKRDEILMAFMLQNGYPINRVYLCLEDTGLCLAYPFDSEKAYGADARQSDWYKHARQRHEEGARAGNELREFAYSKNGMALHVTNSLPIVDINNNFIGAVAFELHTDRLRNILKGTTADKLPRYVIDRYLMTPDGTIASSSHVHDLPPPPSGVELSDNRTIRLALQHNFLETIANYTEATHREFNENGQSIYLHCAYVPGMEMYIVEKTSLTLLVTSLTTPGFERMPAPSPSENEEESRHIR